MMPILASPTVRMPGVVGPRSVAPDLLASARISMASWTGMCSVTTTTSLMPASSVSKTVSLTARAGTKKTEASAPVSFTASATPSKTGTPSTVAPPRPG